MGKVKKICRICGKEYIPCGYCENDKMAFHYRTICCSKECAQAYLQRVLDARSKEKQIDTKDIHTDDVAIEKQKNIESNEVVNDEKPKRKNIKKKDAEVENNNESENSEQIE